MSFEPQTTLKTEVRFSGKGLFSGRVAEMTIVPEKAGTGIRFRRMDLPHHPYIQATIENSKESVRSTSLEENGARVETVEHLLSAFYGLKIDNATIELTGPEIPILDGSAKPFVEGFLKAGIETFHLTRSEFTLDQPIAWSSGDAHLIALPSDVLRISYTLHYPQSSYLKSQFFSFEVTPHNFASEIAPSRTFALYEEIAPLIKKGFLQDAGLSNGIVIREDKVLNPEGVRFPDEPVRHKILDFLGDISLIGARLKAHVIAIRTGHAANLAFGRKLMESMTQSQPNIGGL